MIVGNGLVAKSISKVEIKFRETIFFASGVSNSVNPTIGDFEREKQLLAQFYNRNEKLVYFSTCSVFDKSSNDKAYVRHKLDMEQEIISNFANYLIVRLPTLVGITSNPNTLFNYFKNKILTGETLTIQANAKRFLFDADHLNPVLEQIIRLNNTIVNAAFNNQTSVYDIALAICNNLNKKPNFILKDSGSEFVIDNKSFLKHLDGNVPPNQYDYKAIISKYC